MWYRSRSHSAGRKGRTDHICLTSPSVNFGNNYQDHFCIRCSNDGVSCSFFSIRSYTLERAPSFTDRQTDGQFNLTFQKCLI
ncbi:hypothetical protein SFRURICE_018384 [Spodoptera frugiperda]|nr:hypothetical protein SFRURICE_018384 [Spodoptera frugiperda]